MAGTRKKTAVAQQLKRMGVDAVKEAVDLAKDPDCPPAVSAKIWCELIQYVQPKLRAIEVTGKDGGPVQGVLDLRVEFDDHDPAG